LDVPAALRCDPGREAMNAAQIVGFVGYALVGVALLAIAVGIVVGTVATIRETLAEERAGWPR
jgi:hypothetical protein